MLDKHRAGVCLTAVLVLASPGSYSCVAVSCQLHQFTVIWAKGPTLGHRHLSAEHLAARREKQYCMTPLTPSFKHLPRSVSVWEMP